MATAPQYAATPKCGIATISTANTNRDGTGTIGDVLTTGAAGSRIERLVLQAQGTTTAGMIRLYIHNGTAYKLWREIPVTALTPSGTTAAWTYELQLYDFVLPTGYKFAASTNNAETFNVIAFYGDF
jgi:hypothetical protein